LILSNLYLTCQNHCGRLLDNFIEQEITPIDPTFKLTQKVEPISFNEIQALINTKTSLVEWYITNERILAFIITSSSLKVWQSTSEDLQNLLDWKDKYLEDYQQNKTQWIKTLDSRLNQLSTILHLDEVLDLIPQACNQLILIPHYFLHIFPLHTLPLKNRKFLYECFSQGVGYAPSCQLLQLVQERKAERIEEFNQIFAIQNPTRRDTKSLLGANLEIARISQYFAPQNRTIVAESEASETKLVELQDKIKSTHCLHFSCHGKFNARSPLESALFLADPEGNLGASANLTLAEIFEKLDLQQCRVVTLSACESGVVDPTVISDEYIGIPSGFLFAGSLSVVSTLWTVDPLATTLFMTKFYRYLKRNSQIDELNVTIAANKAQTWLRNLSSKKLARTTDNQKFQQLLKEVFPNQKRDYMKFQDLLEAAVKRQPYPFANPYYWTAFITTGI
jgi:CHAT domain-containing protein